MPIDGHGGVPLCVWDYGGEGPPLLLCHCTGTLGRIWDPLVPLLPGFRVLALDARGHGASGKPRDFEAYAWSRMGRDVLAVIDALEWPLPWYAAGHSCGAAMLGYAALARSAAFRRMVWVDAIVGPEAAFAGENKLAAAARRRREHFACRDDAHENFSAKPPMARWRPAVLDAYLDHGFEHHPDGTLTLACPREIEAMVYEQGGAHEVWHALNTIEVPTRVVTGSASNVASLAEAHATRLPRAELMTVPGASHFVPQEHVEQTAHLIATWCSEAG